MYALRSAGWAYTAICFGKLGPSGGRDVTTRLKDQRLAWLVCGFLAGLCVAYVWPHEQAYAVATDRDQRFAVSTVEVGIGNPEAVFVLDFLTGRLHGAMLNSQTGAFTNFWIRNIAADFQVGGEGTKAQYAMIPGLGNINSGRGATMAVGLLYIGELTTGKLAAYRFPYKTSRTPIDVGTLELFAFFPFREATRE